MAASRTVVICASPSGAIGRSRNVVVDDVRFPGGSELYRSGSELDRQVDRAAALARELAPQTERERTLADELLEELRGSGLMRAGAPETLGALQAPPAVTLACAERIARATRRRAGAFRSRPPAAC